MSKSSQISGFYKLSIDERLKIVTDFSGLSEEEVNLLRAESSLKLEIADRMIENVIGVYPLPLGVATNFLINGKDYLIPMVIEEPSVVAAASHGAKMARVKGGFKALSTEPIMIGQVQVVKVPDPYGARMRLLEAKEEILAKANEQDPTLVKLGGGAKDLDVKVIDSIRGPMVILELHVDCKDAMGANIVNGMAEAVAPLVEKIAGGKVLLRILSNLAVKRLARAKAVVAKEAVGGEEVVDAILEAYAFALADPFRAATHNKGIMNGIVAVATATGNDTRAIEAGAHAYAARFGRYMPLSTWEKNADGDLVGTLEMPLAVGIVGGATRTHPIAKIALKILGVKTARELSEVMCSVGLAQNLAALKALATEGIQRGHMELHARNLAIAAGAVGDLVDKVAEQMVRERRISFDRAKQILQELTQKK
ncbi:MAG: hydroxymethylglutaryl-CoA reductase, degradative [Candidatus Methanomethylicota archaeon]|uniref:3-hydroxy-3-methylglutaryl coenzyme A reductase n=1 Tax=Thermoproteota archaeon TaxID=2056631 RepID=A0A497F1V8_9CREN|nr:MAG: hydroxymethylglutaryl-CoA reductase, degradative [Candidatus Verstraetearchaeota archaeon]